MYWDDNLVKVFCRIYSNGPSRYGKTIDEKMEVFKKEIKNGDYYRELWLNEKIYINKDGIEYDSFNRLVHECRIDYYKSIGYNSNEIENAWEDKLKQMIGGAIKMGMLAIGNGEKCPYCDIIITEDINTVDHLFSKHPDEANEALFGNRSEET